MTWIRLAVLLVPAILVSRAQAMDVATCGQIVPARDVGVLVGDLDCAASAVAVVLGRNARLELNGFRLSGNFPGWIGVECQAGTCFVNGPGEVSGFDFGVTAGGAQRVSVSGIDFDNNTWSIFHDRAGLASVADTTIRDCLNGAGVLARRLRVAGVTVERCINGLSVIGSVKGEGLVVSGNSNAGVAAGRSANLTDVTATGNSIGIDARSIRLVDSEVTGNAQVDLASGRRPRLSTTICETSRNFNTGETFGVCQAD